MNGIQTEAVTGEGSSKQESIDEEQPFLYDTIVIVLVGPEKYRFEIHKTLVCGESDFFKAALNGNFKEADGTITLPEQDPATFKYFVYWLYTGSLRGFYYPKSNSPTMAELRDLVRAELKAHDISIPDELPEDNSRRILWEQAQCRDLPFNSLIALYILADVLLVQGLKDPVITALIEVYGLNSPGKHGVKLYWQTDLSDPLKNPSRGINMAWEALPKESNLCELLVRLFCDSSLLEEPHHFEGSLRIDFLISVGQKYAERWMYDSPTSQWTTPEVICTFHEHEGWTCALSEMYLEDRKKMASG